MINTYFDNAATSFPKPRAVADRIYHYVTDVGGTYGRSAYSRVFETSKVIETVREKLSEKLGINNPDKLFFTSNATSALNTIIFGLRLHNCHILLSPLEHNAVTRPVEELRKSNGITFDILPHGPDGIIDTDQIKSVIRKDTKLVIVNHQSNVNGIIQPIQKIKQLIGDIPLLLDLAQSLGHTEIDCEALGIDFAAFTGHKGLLGPTGTGGLYINNPAQVSPLLFGGTGSRSESFEMPTLLPDKFEAGTPNIAGIYGLLGALENTPLEHYSQEQFFSFIRDIESLSFLKCIRASDLSIQGSLFSIVHRKFNSSQFADALFSRFRIETRCGLHCAPLAHKTLGTFPEGTVRIALSPYHTGDDLKYVYESLQKMENL